MNSGLMAWLKAAGIRAAKTFAQTLLAVILLGEPMADVLAVDWRGALGVAVLAAIASLLTSIVGLPEAPVTAVSSTDTRT